MSSSVLSPLSFQGVRAAPFPRFQLFSNLTYLVIFAVFFSPSLRRRRRCRTDHSFSEVVVPFPVSIEIPLICAVKHPLACPSVIFPSCVCVQIRSDQVSHCGRRSGQCGGAARLEQGHSALLWSPTDDDRLLCNVTLPVLWGWRKVQGGGFSVLWSRPQTRRLRQEATTCPMLTDGCPFRPQHWASPLLMGGRNHRVPFRGHRK